MRAAVQKTANPAKIMKKDGKRRGKGGFTLVELAVTLVIMSILFAIAVPNLLGYIHLSQFRRNESCAKTMYLSAESALTYCRTGGEWESFCRRVKDEGVLNRSFDESDGEQKKLSGRIYGIRLDADEYASGELSGDGSLVDELLSQDTYDKSLLNAAICIEIDVESGHVYSVFYGTSCKGLYYGSASRRSCPVNGWTWTAAPATTSDARSALAITRCRTR